MESLIALSAEVVLRITGVKGGIVCGITFTFIYLFADIKSHYSIAHMRIAFKST